MILKKRKLITLPLLDNIIFTILFYVHCEMNVRDGRLIFPNVLTAARMCLNEFDTKPFDSCVR